jgi:hypothetical protein
VSSLDPHRHHGEQLAARRETAATLDVADRRLSLARLGVVLATLALLWGTLWQGWFSTWWLLAPTGVFVFLVRAHDRVIRAHTAASRAVQWYERGLARLEDRWTDSGETGVRFVDDDHPYCRDLDLFGEGSLFQLLNTAQTTTGEETLADWLLTAAEPATIEARQAAGTDLSSRMRLREDLYALGADARRVIDTGSLVRWATGPATLDAPWLKIVPPILGVSGVVSVGVWLYGSVPFLVPLGFLLVNAMVGIAFNRSVARVLHGSSEPSRELMVLASVFGRLGQESYEADRLRELGETLIAQETDPMVATQRLDRLIQMHDWQHNLVFAPVAAALLWGLQCAVAVEAWRARHGAAVPEWLHVVGEFEALAAFGTYRFEHPDDVFPEIVSDVGDDTLVRRPPVYQATGLAHPLLPVTQAVANDVTLGAAPQLIVVSGSNMSGKTTLLRTVGVNGVLALAGAPVRAKTLRISPVAIGGTLRVQDSLLAGRSRFYAEILRVKLLVEIAKGPRPLLFLMDELFHGTNSHDRVEGAHGVLDYLVGLGAVGMVTTHDLALAAIGDRLGARAVNVHFADELKDATLSFDYTLRAGRSTHGNALALMRAVGLAVTEPDG